MYNPLLNDYWSIWPIFLVPREKKQFTDSEYKCFITFLYYKVLELHIGLLSFALLLFYGARDGIKHIVRARQMLCHQETSSDCVYLSDCVLKWVDTFHWLIQFYSIKK